jgi:hypothetical protein
MADGQTAESEETWPVELKQKALRREETSQHRCMSWVLNSTTR